MSRGAFYVLFTASGFAGLIYESIWTQYLKLFLGHAAYAQSLVLAVFMGGMAAGAAYCARFSARLSNPLMGYALVEAVVGLAALAFHPVFVSLTDWAHASLLPALGGDWLALGAKLTAACLLILPQSVLLGMTFPLMSAGLARAHPAAAGESVAMLYFTNSLGAAAGVLTSGFLLIAWVAFAHWQTGHSAAAALEGVAFILALFGCVVLHEFAMLAVRMDYTRATQLAATIGQGMAFVFGLLGLFFNPFLVFIALFVWIGAGQEAAMTQMKAALACR